MAEQTSFAEFSSEIEHVLKFKPLKRPVWTQHKALLIARYLRYFVYITHHGNYIDGFAGPQRERKEGAGDMWSARLALQNEPRWLRKFFLYDLDPTQGAALKRLVEEDAETHEEMRRSDKSLPKRRYDVKIGDFNAIVDDVLANGALRPKEATFALLDQRSLECNWDTVAKLANFKSPPEHKIEIFYFLATGWLERTLAAHKKVEKIDAWWGSSEWAQVRKSSGQKWAAEVVRRFKTELGYKYVVPWPITELEKGKGRTMYYMIHATDHPEAPKLMNRAYNSVLAPPESHEQIQLALGLLDPA